MGKKKKNSSAPATTGEAPTTMPAEHATAATRPTVDATSASASGAIVPSAPATTTTTLATVPPPAVAPVAQQMRAPPNAVQVGFNLTTLGGGNGLITVAVGEFIQLELQRQQLQEQYNKLLDKNERLKKDYFETQRQSVANMDRLTETTGRLAAAAEKATDQAARMTTLQGQVSQLQQENSTAKAEVVSLREQVHHLRLENATLAAENQQLKARLATLESEVGSLKADHARAKQRILVGELAFQLEKAMAAVLYPGDPKYFRKKLSDIAQDAKANPDFKTRWEQLTRDLAWNEDHEWALGQLKQMRLADAHPDHTLLVGPDTLRPLVEQFVPEEERPYASQLIDMLRQLRLRDATATTSASSSSLSLYRY